MTTGGEGLAVLWTPLRVLAAINSVLLWIGRQGAWIALVIMVFAILAQVFWRYVLSNPLPWPEEAARFFMLWMVGLIAPSGYRWGGFVAIDLLPRMLPVRAGMVLNIAILAVSLVVLVVAVQLGWKDVTGFGGQFASASLWVPVHFDYVWKDTLLPTEIAYVPEPEKIAKKYMMVSLVIGLALMVLINIELILRSLIKLLDPGAEVDPDPEMMAAGAD